jgi:hypothetical protein
MSFTFKIYCLGLLACGEAAWSRSIFDSQEAAREGYQGRMEGMTGHEALSLLALNKWHNRFVNGRITLEDNSQSEKSFQSNFCEFLRSLIEETPFISCKRMCQELRIPKTTCLRLLHEDLGFRK